MDGVSDHGGPAGMKMDEAGARLDGPVPGVGETGMRGSGGEIIFGGDILIP